ncbi:hypothetical protein LX32DRAFT_134173 [Colletotrichum zoysiae]|uniref:Uncharacterized protein n=1 Tax=Colletotrichum zoysiae TaxID=1216348 RepID=A0AAD9LZE9_9PEZI|nr:hypothetical protein LX32DRAFT_134173 [Colletotrichum zoysiae]
MCLYTNLRTLRKSQAQSGLFVRPDISPHLRRCLCKRRFRSVPTAIRQRASRPWCENALDPPEPLWKPLARSNPSNRDISHTRVLESLLCGPTRNPPTKSGCGGGSSPTPHLNRSVAVRECVCVCVGSAFWQVAEGIRSGGRSIRNPSVSGAGTGTHLSSLPPPAPFGRLSTASTHLTARHSPSMQPLPIDRAQASRKKDQSKLWGGGGGEKRKRVFVVPGKFR